MARNDKKSQQGEARQDSKSGTLTNVAMFLKCGHNLTGADSKLANCTGADSKLAYFTGADSKLANCTGADSKLANCRGADSKLAN